MEFGIFFCCDIIQHNFVISRNEKSSQVTPQSLSSIFVEFLVRFLVPRNDKKEKTFVKVLNFDKGLI